jgi:hypothetical protein
MNALSFLNFARLAFAEMSFFCEAAAVFNYSSTLSLGITQITAPPTTQRFVGNKLELATFLCPNFGRKIDNRKELTH